MKGVPMPIIPSLHLVFQKKEFMRMQSGKDYGSKNSMQGEEIFDFHPIIREVFKKPLLNTFCKINFFLFPP